MCAVCYRVIAELVHARRAKQADHVDPAPGADEAYPDQLIRTREGWAIK